MPVCITVDNICVMTDEGEDAVYLETFGRRLAALRVQRGLSQDDLARAVGLRASEMRRVERGQRDLSVIMLADLAEALQVFPGDLMP
jgi:transcriptional regulator with XRE-family HTH domain